jgi:hypothetical protein
LVVVVVVLFEPYEIQYQVLIALLLDNILSLNMHHKIIENRDYCLFSYHRIIFLHVLTQSLVEKNV